MCSTFLCSLVWLLRGQWCFPYLVGHSVWTGRWEVPTPPICSAEKDHNFHGPYCLRFVVAHNRLHFSQFNFNMHLLKYNPQCLKLQKENAASFWGLGASLSETLLSGWMLRTGCWKFYLGHPQGEQWWWAGRWRWGCREDGGENKNLVINRRLCSYSGREECAPTFLPLFLPQIELSLWCQELC